jgi:DNA repair ATPase RecN
LAYNPELDLVAEPEMTTADFRGQCAELAREKRDEETEALKAKYEKKIDAIRKKLEREERELAEDQAELSARKMEEVATHAENVLGLFTGSRSSRRISTSMTKRRMTAKAKADVEESEDAIESFKAELVDLENEVAEELQELTEKWAEAATQIEEFKLNPLKKNIFVEAFGLAWMPYWRILINERPLEVPAFSPEG